MIRNIYYICPKASLPVGGVQKIYQHVDVLNQNGFHAYVLHQEKNYRYAWRKNETPTAYFELDVSRLPLLKMVNWCSKRIKTYSRCIKARINHMPFFDWHLLRDYSSLFCLGTSNKKIKLPKLNDQDVLVHPEYLVPELLPLINNFPSVILNFTAYQTYKCLNMQQILEGSVQLPYDNPKLLGCIVGSEDTSQYLNYTYPSLPLFLCPFGVNTDQFTYHSEKKRQIAFMPRRCPEHLVQIVSILKQRNKLPGWSFVPLQNMPQEEVVKQMQSSAIFLSTSYFEGFGLPPAEALACGSLVVGYDGEGGREFFKPPFAYSIPHGNIIAFVKKIEELASLYDSDRALFLKMGKEGSDFIKEKYLIEEENRSVVNTWKQLAQRHFPHSETAQEPTSLNKKFDF